MQYHRSFRFTIFGVLAGLLACLSLTGCNRGSAETQKTTKREVTTAHPIIRSIQDEDDYNGWLEAVKQVDVRARVRGHILKVCFEDGEIVKAGQLLFQLDQRPFETSKKEAEAQADALKSQQVAAAKTLVRYDELIKSRAVSQQEYDEVKAKEESFASQRAAMLQNVEKFDLDLKYCNVAAPIDGKVGRALLTEGNLVNAGGNDSLLTTIVSVTPMYIDFSIDERSLQRYQKSHEEENKKGPATPLREKKLPFSFGLETDQGFPHQGVIDFLDNQVNPATGTIPVRGVVDNADGKFTSGSRVRVRIPITNKYDALLVPDVAVNTDQNKKFLWTVDTAKGNIVGRCNIELGRLLDDGMRVVLRPDPKLTTSDWIIVEGLQKARLHQPVDPIPEKAAGQ